MNRDHDTHATDPTPAGCEAFIEELTHLVLGELEGERRAAIEAHLAGCAACRGERELLDKCVHAVRDDAAGAAPILRLSAERQCTLLAEAARVALVRPFWNARRLAAAAAAIVMAGAGGYLGWEKLRAPGHLHREEVAVSHMSLAFEDFDRDADQVRDEWKQKVSDAAAAGGKDATVAVLAEMEKNNVELAPSELASLSIELVQVDQAGAALEVLKLAPDRRELDELTAERLEQVVRFVEREYAEQQPAGEPASASGHAIERLRALGYLGGDAEDAGEPTVAEVVEEQLGVPASKPAPVAHGGGRAAAPKLADRVEIERERNGSELSADELRRLKEATEKRPRHGSASNGKRAAAGAPDATEARDARAEQLTELGYPAQSDGAAASPHGTTATPGLSALDSKSKQVPVPPVSGLGQSQSLLFDDGTAETTWKVFYPTEAGDAFLVDIDQDGLDATIWKKQNPAGSRDYFGVSKSAEHRASTEALFDAALGQPPLFGDPLLDGYFFRAPAGHGAVANSAGIQAAFARIALAAPSDVVAFEGELRRAGGGRTLDVDAVVRTFLDRLSPRQGEAPRDMFFRWFGDHSFVPTRCDALSTFGMDVDTASYNLARSYLAKGTLPPKAAVRTEEFVNAFRQELAAPEPGSADVFCITTELAPSPFGGEGRWLLRAGLKALEIDRAARKPAALTFVIDVSGSMREGNRLDLVKQALALLVAQLDERDTIGIVVFSEQARRALPPTNAAHQARILAALDQLRPEQSTNAGAGLRLGYDMALEQLRPDADNRVVMCSDGVANTGVTDPDQLTARIRECKGRRIGLTTIGVGMNNHNDALLEQLAREGDGTCHYVDQLAEAKELFVDQLTGTLSTVARDAKIQVEFDPRSVRSFRQLGYENRALAHRDFRNDRVDAGEVGAGHEVVALYELELARDAAGPLATVRCRYEDTRTATIREQARVAFAAESFPTVASAPARWRLDAAVAEFAELLRQSVHARDGSFGAVMRLAEPLVAELPGDPDVPEFVALVQQAARLPDLLPARTELVRCVDELKKVRCWQEELRRADPPQQQANSELMRQLEEQNRRLEEALREALASAAGR